MSDELRVLTMYRDAGVIGDAEFEVLAAGPAEAVKPMPPEPVPSGPQRAPRSCDYPLITPAPGPLGGPNE
jgi:hypothetical protein